MVVLCSISDLGKYKRSNRDVTFAIVRYMDSAIDGIQQFSRLAPSADLFAFTQANQDTEGFWFLYHAMYQKELVSNEKQVGLALVEDLVRTGVEVNLVCYCKDSTKCHREDVYHALLNRGVACELY